MVNADGPGPYLLDVNFLLAHAWPAHSAHSRATAWFKSNAHRGWATCPITEAGLIRLIVNPMLRPHACTMSEAIDLLGKYTSHSDHEFWPDKVAVVDALAPFSERLFGHRQITDAYLLGLAMSRGGNLATLDRGMRELLSSRNLAARKALVVVE